MKTFLRDDVKDKKKVDFLVEFVLEILPNLFFDSPNFIKKTIFRQFYV